VDEPGLDRHEWETQWEALQPELADAPAEALPEVDRLIGGMLAERDLEDVDPEIERELEQAREVTRRLDAGEDVDPGDIAVAVLGYRALYEDLLAERRSPSG
jgi:hypothetical protein